MSRQTSRAADAADLSLTERRNPRSADIDLASAAEIVDLMAAEDALVPAAVATQRDAIARAIDIAVTTFREGGRLFYTGAGTSGRLGVLDASECPPTFGTDPEMVQGLIAGGPAALTRAQEGAEDRPEDGARDLDARGLSARDFVVGIAASAATPYVRGALARARAAGARTALVANSPPSEELGRDIRRGDRAGRGPGGRHGFDASQVGDRDEARAQHDHDWSHDPPGQDLWQPHGRPPSDQREAALAQRTHGGGRL